MPSSLTARMLIANVVTATKLIEMGTSDQAIIDHLVHEYQTPRYSAEGVVRRVRRELRDWRNNRSN